MEWLWSKIKNIFKLFVTIKVIWLSLLFYLFYFILSTNYNYSLWHMKIKKKLFILNKKKNNYKYLYIDI